MFARVKQSRNGEYLQVVENYREAGKVRQRMVLYVGRYDGVADALELMPRDVRVLRGRATRMGKEDLRREADVLAERLEALRGLVEEHPELLAHGRSVERLARRRRGTSSVGHHAS